MKNKRKKKEFGFTLIELLAVIVIVSVLIGLSVYFAINVISGSKEKSYQVTINNVESVASSYLLENSEKLFYVIDENNIDIEYQCVTVEDLIENGYFKNDILDSQVTKDRNVELSDYIYVERDVATKNVIKAKYLLDEDITLCEEAVKTSGDVVIYVEPIGWSAYKDITISYKLKNYYNVDDYIYEYIYSKSNVMSVISDNGNVKKIRVTDNGVITGYIKDENGNIIAQSSKEITNIDKIPPVITINGNLTRIYASEFNLFDGVNVIDNSGLETTTKMYVDNKEITNSIQLSLGDNIVYYKSVDEFGNEAVSENRIIKLVVADKEFNYKEEEQIYNVQADGTYIIEAYGAQGGNSGGKGGYVKAEVPLRAGDKLYINTGGVNGYNGGGAYKNSSYYSGGGGTTVKYSDSLIVIAGGGGAKGPSGNGGTGGNGNGAGGADVGAGAGKSGTNGGGGSSSNNHSYSCNCYTYSTGCVAYAPRVCVCAGASGACPSLDCSGGGCAAYGYGVACSTCTSKGKSGTGGSSSAKSPAVIVQNVPGSRSGNGYVKVSYKIGE